MTNLLDLITPTNLESEHDKFFASNTYHPTFHYIWQDQVMQPIFTNKLKKSLWQSIKTQDNSGITKAAQQLFEVEVTGSLLKQAMTDASTKGKVSGGSPEEYCDQLRSGLDYFGLDDVQVILTDVSGFNSRPNHKASNITVSKHIHFDYFSVEGGVHHEIVHVLRYRNGIYNHIKRGERYLPTEEGLASWCQDNANDDNGHAQHAIEYVASSVGITGSLRDIYNCMCELGMDPELSWKRATRHKFGFVDTSKPGDILKPAMYYANEEKIAKLSTDEKLRLFVGKIALSDLSNYPVYTGLWPGQKIVDYFNL